MRKFVMFLGLFLSPLFMLAQDFGGKSLDWEYVECTAYDQMGDVITIHSAYSEAATIEEWFDENGDLFFRYAFLHTSTHPDNFDTSFKDVLIKNNITSYFITKNGDGISFCTPSYRLVDIAVTGDASYAFTLLDLSENEKFIIEITLVDCKPLGNPLDNGSKL